MIKKYLMTVLLFISICSYSQENKNKFMLNGNASYYNNSMNSKRTFVGSTGNYSNLWSVGSVGINLGYFLSDNFVIGVSGSVNSNISKSRSNANSNYLSTYNSGFIINNCGIFARYNHVLNSGKLAIFLQVGTHYNWGEETIVQESLDGSGSLKTTKSTEKNTGSLVTLTPGVIYFINNKFSVESRLGSVYYSSSKSTPDDNTSTVKRSILAADFSLTNINLGFTYYFGRKQE